MTVSLRRLAALAVALTGAFLLAYFPQALPHDYAPEQPIEFSHRVHVERGIACVFCHADVGAGSFAGIPPVLKCMGCHRVIIPYYPQVQKLHVYWSEQIPIPWKRVNFVPDFVRFSHQPHIAAGLSCETCHGDIGAMDRVQEAVAFNMSTCITCHRAMGARTDCFETCHH